jgi:hypothetical protein
VRHPPPVDGGYDANAYREWEEDILAARAVARAVQAKSCNMPGHSCSLACTDAWLAIQAMADQQLLYHLHYLCYGAQVTDRDGLTPAKHGELAIAAMDRALAAIDMPPFQRRVGDVRQEVAARVTMLRLGRRVAP